MRKVPGMTSPYAGTPFHGFMTLIQNEAAHEVCALLAQLEQQFNTPSRVSHAQQQLCFPCLRSLWVDTCWVTGDMGTQLSSPPRSSRFRRHPPVRLGLCRVRLLQLGTHQLCG